MNKSKELKNTTKLVKYILEQYPTARNSDNILYCYVLMEIGNRTGIHYEEISIEKVLMNMKEFGLPSIETVGRCRRKIVEQCPELAGNSEVEAQRALNEETFKEYAKVVI
jgi:hypothetical protein